jgi:hypothetical protein
MVKNGPVAAAAVQTAGSIPSPFDGFIMAINANPYFIGFMMLMLNLGGRFIGLELTKSQEAFLQNVWVRRLLIFIVLFMGTRSVLVAFWMWLAVVFLLGYVLNENSSMCIFGTGLPGSKCVSVSGSGSGSAGAGAKEGFMQQSKLTQEEADILAKLKAKAGESSLPQSSSPLTEEHKEEDQHNEDEVSTYLDNMNVLRTNNDNPRF